MACSMPSLAKSVHDAGLGNLIRLITEKAENQGRTVLRIRQWEPTTQTCSVCGTPGGKKPLSIREWTCGGCQTRLDRDYNAAVNIMVAAGRKSTRGRGRSLVRWSRLCSRIERGFPYGRHVVVALLVRM